MCQVQPASSLLEFVGLDFVIWCLTQNLQLPTFNKRKGLRPPNWNHGILE